VGFGVGEEHEGDAVEEEAQPDEVAPDAKVVGEPGAGDASDQEQSDGTNDQPTEGDREG